MFCNFIGNQFLKFTANQLCNGVEGYPNLRFHTNAVDVLQKRCTHRIIKRNGECSRCELRICSMECRNRRTRDCSERIKTYFYVHQLIGVIKCTILLLAARTGSARAGPRVRVCRARVFFRTKLVVDRSGVTTCLLFSCRFRQGFKQFFSFVPCINVRTGSLIRREVVTSRYSYSGSPDAHYRIVRNGNRKPGRRGVPVRCTFASTVASAGGEV